jgi:WhiB family transcriptional regulator, redox-sensing transcriptional regulator
MMIDTKIESMVTSMISTMINPMITALDPLSKACPDDVPCRVHDPDYWFAESPDELEQAKAWCRECPARAACLATALERQEPWGVWGGEIIVRGAILPRKRPRGRPRKSDQDEVAA